MKKKIFSIMVIMFISGGILGFFIGEKRQSQKIINRKMHRRTEGKNQQKKRMVKYFTSSLKLTKIQQKELDKLIDNILKGKQQLEAKNKPKRTQLLKSFNTELRNILDDSQKKKFNKMRKKRESKLFPSKPMHGRGLRQQRKQGHQ